ncbi:MAG: hypothetical protein HXY46_16040 [Syntrophaceae bacterium]|nr:hypothetical protein [Syntrophaceae bacterium]
MLREDFFIQSNVRRILVRSHIDYSELTFGTVRGVVYLQGRLKILGAYSHGASIEDEELGARTLRSLELKIRGIPGVVDIKFQLVNWKKEKGQWTPTEKKE